MRRMRQTLKSTYYLRKATETKDSEGSTYKTWGNAEEIQAIIRHISDTERIAQYGERADSMLKMQYEGSTSIKIGDGVCVYVESTSDPDYIVKFIHGLTPNAFKVYGLEAV